MNLQARKRGTYSMAVRQAHGTPSRKQVIGVGLAALAAAVVPVGLVQAATEKKSRTTVPVGALLQGYPQLYQQHSLSCEAAAASMATAGWVTEQQILNQMPRNANPYLGFRGNVDGGQSLADGLASYGIYAPPLAKELQIFGYFAQVISGSGAPLLLRQSIGVLQRPVIVWITHGLGNYGSVTDSVAGQTFTLFNGEHARLAIGYDAYGIHTLDPIDGPQYDSWAVFTAPWSRFNYMGIIVGPRF
jgi:uncharacterized protein YvpB